MAGATVACEGVVNAALRRTKIVATIGPASAEPQTLRRLIDAGVDVFRINFSHASQAEFDLYFKSVRELSAATGRTVGVLADLQGPKLRVGELANHQALVLSDGDPIEITTKPVVGTRERISTSYAALPKDVQAGDRILLADGAIELRVISTDTDAVRCTVVHGGKLGEHKGINLPGIKISVPALTEKDRDDLAHAVRAGVDFIAISFVRRPHDVVEAKQLVREAGSDTPVVAKIEKPDAIDSLDEIMDASDAVMVARGDLGVEMAPERVPTLQKHIIRRANTHLIPCITATQMLESMVHAPRPTRAEASDVANAIIDGTDALMLSEETAAGEYPVETVQTMVRIALDAEANFPPRERRRRRVDNDSHAIAHAACYIAESIDTRAIAAFTRSGFSARIVSKDRPIVPIYAFVPDDAVGRRLALDWAVLPLVIDFGRSTEELLQTVETELLRREAARRGEAVIVVGGSPLGVRGRTNFLRIIRAGESVKEM